MYQVLNDCSKVLIMRVARVVLCMQEALGLEFRGLRVPSLMAWACYMWVDRAVSVSSCILKVQFPEGKMDGRMERRKNEKRKEGRGKAGKKEGHFLACYDSTKQKQPLCPPCFERSVELKSKLQEHEARQPPLLPGLSHGPRTTFTNRCDVVFASLGQIWMSPA